MAFTNTIPNFNIMAPKDFYELEEMLEFAVDLKKPVLIRYPRGKEDIKFENCEKIKLGRSEILEKGNDITIIAIGKMVSRAIEVANILKEKNITSTVINARFLKPFDEKTLLNNINKSIITIEDGTIIGGLGSKVEEILSENKINVKLNKIAYPDEFIKHGNVGEIERKYKIDTFSIVDKAIQMNKVTNINKAGEA